MVSEWWGRRYPRVPQGSPRESVHTIRVVPPPKTGRRRARAQIAIYEQNVVARQNKMASILKRMSDDVNDETKFQFFNQNLSNQRIEA